MDFKIKIKVVLLFFSCFITTSLSAQITAINGYIISNENDTVPGRLEYANSGYHNKCVFIKDNSSEVEFFKPGDIREFCLFPDINFVSAGLSGKKVFLRVLSRGKINLYEDDLDLYISTDKDSIAKLSGGKDILTIKGQRYSQEDNSYKILLWKYSPDRFYYNRIDELSFDPEKITSLVKEINGNENRGIAPGQPGKTVHKFRFGIETGISYNTVRLKNIPNKYYEYLISGLKSEEENKRSAFFAGINCTWKPGGGNSYFSGSVDFDFLRKEDREEDRFVVSETGIFDPFTGESSYNYDTLGTAIYKYSYNLTSVRFPIVFHQEVSYNRIRPFFDAGLSVRYIFKTDGFLTREININGSPIHNEYYFDVPAFIFSLRAGTGIRYIINADYSLYAGVSIEASSFSPEGPGIGRYTSKSAYLSFNF